MRCHSLKHQSEVYLETLWIERPRVKGPAVVALPPKPQLHSFVGLLQEPEKQKKPFKTTLGAQIS